MKRFAIFAATAAIATAGSAWADKSISVATPQDPASKEQAATYLAELDHAAKKVCVAATGPVIGVNFYNYQACLKATRADIAKKDPTGLQTIFLGERPGDPSPGRFHWVFRRPGAVAALMTPQLVH
jgi:hypothetical protein